MLLLQAPLTSQPSVGALEIADGVVWEDGGSRPDDLHPVAVLSTLPVETVLPLSVRETPSGLRSRVSPLTHRMSPAFAVDGGRPSWNATLAQASAFLDECRRTGVDSPTLISLQVDFGTLCSRGASFELVGAALALSADGVFCLFDLDPRADPSTLVFALGTALGICAEFAECGRSVWVGQAGILGPLFRLFNATAFAVQTHNPFRTTSTRNPALAGASCEERVLIPGLLVDVPTSTAERIAREAPDLMRCPGLDPPPSQTSSLKDQTLIWCLRVLKAWDRASDRPGGSVDELFERLDRAQAAAASCRNMGFISTTSPSRRRRSSLVVP